MTVSIVGSPPLTRGKGRLCAARPCKAGITPAHAGKSAVICRMAPCARDHPRSRGEKPSPRMDAMASSGSPPLTRGKVLLRYVAHRVDGITPAHAGKRRPAPDEVIRCWDHPRSRGEKFSTFSTCHSQPGSPPLTRGKDVVHRRFRAGDGITPAHAGKSPSGSLGCGSRWDHPRSRGEKTTPVWPSSSM